VGMDRPRCEVLLDAHCNPIAIPTSASTTLTRNKSTDIT
jgi:hypothetical protein